MSIIIFLFSYFILTNVINNYCYHFAKIIHILLNIMYISYISLLMQLLILQQQYDCDAVIIEDIMAQKQEYLCIINNHCFCTHVRMRHKIHDTPMPSLNQQKSNANLLAIKLLYILFSTRVTVIENERKLALLIMINYQLLLFNKNSFAITTFFNYFNSIVIHQI